MSLIDAITQTWRVAIKNQKITQFHHADNIYVKLKTKPKPIVQTKSKGLYWLYKDKNVNIPHCRKIE